MTITRREALRAGASARTGLGLLRCYSRRPPAKSSSAGVTTVVAVLLVISTALPAFGGALPAPDDRLTPGAVLERVEPRPSLPPEVVREVARRYGITLSAQDRLGVHDPSCGAPRCEIDHRVPVGCGGATVADNLSYQSAPWWQKKDRLEHWFERQVKLGKISVEACQQAFSAPNDWRARYKIIFGEEP